MSTKPAKRTPLFYVQLRADGVYVIERFVMGNRETLKMVFPTRAEAQLVADDANETRE